MQAYARKKSAVAWVAAALFLLQARAQDFSLPSPLGSSAPIGNPGTFSDIEPATTAPLPEPTPETTPEPAAAPAPTQQPALRPRPAPKARPAATKKAEEPIKAENPKKQPKQEDEKAAATDGKMPKAVIRGIIDGTLRFSPKEFAGLKKGQILIVESKNPGEVAARVEVTAVNKARTTAAAKVIKAEAVKETPALVGLTLYRETDFKQKYAQTDIAAVIAPKPILGRNHLLAAHLNFISATSSAANVMTGLDLNQETQSFALVFEGFLPDDLPRFFENKVGLRLAYAQSLPSTVVGRVASTDETQTFSLSSNEFKAALVYKSRAKSGSLSQIWATLGYSMTSTKSAWETNVGSGNTNLSLELKGPELSVGGDFSPLPFLYLGSDVVAGIPQKWTSTDSGNKVSRSGKWNNYIASAYTELRYPIGAAKKDLFTLQVKGGMNIDQVQLASGSNAKKENFVTPVFLVGVGYFTK